jgi:hypothetical protein
MLHRFAERPMPRHICRLLHKDNMDIGRRAPHDMLQTVKGEFYAHAGWLACKGSLIVSQALTKLMHMLN